MPHPRVDLRRLLVASLLLPMAMGSARAEEADPAEPSADQKGFYATLGLGAAWPQNVTGDTTVLGIPVNGSYGLNGGFAGEIGAGYDFGPVRTELTYTYTNANLMGDARAVPVTEPSRRDTRQSADPRLRVRRRHDDH